MKLLIVDDIKSIRLYLKEIFKSLNLKIFEAENGEKALTLIQEHSFDLILMDIEMPGESGIEITRKVRKELKFKHTPIIIMTSLKDPKLMKEAFLAGASDYIHKPLVPEEVIARVEIRLKNRAMERELLMAKSASERANQAKSEFMTRLAHELKTPLNAISGFTQLIEIETEDKSILESCGFILTGVKHQSELISEVTNLAQIEAGIIDIQYSDVDLTTIIKEAFNLTMLMAKQFNVRLNFPKIHDVDYRLTTDHKRLKQIFLNLLSNAIKYNKLNGEVNILVKPISIDRIKIGISDTGEGIKTEDIPKLFEAFNRLGAEDSEIEGTGIGLPITKKIIELMDGQLEVESTLGKGTTFWVELQAIHKNIST